MFSALPSDGCQHGGMFGRLFRFFLGSRISDVSEDEGTIPAITSICSTRDGTTG